MPTPALIIGDGEPNVRPTSTLVSADFPFKGCFEYELLSLARGWSIGLRLLFSNLRRLLAAHRWKSFGSGLSFRRFRFNQKIVWLRVSLADVRDRLRPRQAELFSLDDSDFDSASLPSAFALAGGDDLGTPGDSEEEDRGKQNQQVRGYREQRTKPQSLSRTIDHLLGFGHKKHKNTKKTRNRFALFGGYLFLHRLSHQAHVCLNLLRLIEHIGDDSIRRLAIAAQIDSPVLRSGEPLLECRR